MSVPAFKAIGGLPEYDVVGSGDLHFAFSLINQVSNGLKDQLHPQFKNMVFEHSKRTYETLQAFAKAQGKELVGYVPLTISHNWHGSRKDRQYVGRWKILIAHQFNFPQFVRRNESGLLQFLPNAQKLQQDILNHFIIRKEDNKQSTDHDFSIVPLQQRERKEKEGHAERAIIVDTVNLLPVPVTGDGNFPNSNGPETLANPDGEWYSEIITAAQY